MSKLLCQNFRDFAQIFDKSKFLGSLTPPIPTSLVVKILNLFYSKVQNLRLRCFRVNNLSFNFRDITGITHTTYISGAAEGVKDIAGI